MFLAIELCLAGICFSLAYIFPQLGNAWIHRIESRFSDLSDRSGWTVVSVGFLALGVRLALLPILPIPQPKVQDEFSYLLLSDTLAHGHLANPTHPMWVHFETFHVNWNPTYASMYYPGYGIFLAFGQAILGHPFWGVWLSSGLMCAGICWALQGWMSSSWALLGGLLAVIRLGTFSYWADSYWGGTVTALGGALALGAFARIKQGNRARNSVLMAIGMVILASTRPYEGLFFCVPIIAGLLFWTLREDSISKKTVLREVGVPAGLIFIVGFFALGYYFWRVTGNPFTIPYQVNIRSYGLIYFPWEKIRPIQYHHTDMQNFYRGGAVLGFYHMARSHPFKLQFAKLLVLWLFYFGPVFSLAWVAWLFSRPRKRFWTSFTPELRFLLTVCFSTYISLVLTIHLGQPHYAAPLTAAFYAITLLMMRDLYVAAEPTPAKPTRFIARSVPVICVVLLLARTAAPLLHAAPKPSWIRTWCSQDEENLERARILKQLEETPGKHLAIVRYQPNHDFILDEWVYNKADIDGAKVVWARDMGPQNTELLQYFKNRRVWLVEPDYNPAKLSPYVQ